MAVKLHEVHSELFKAIGEDYSKFTKAELIKLDLFVKLLMESNIAFDFLRESNHIYLNIVVPLPAKLVTVLAKLQYIMVGGRIKIL